MFLVEGSRANIKAQCFCPSSKKIFLDTDSEALKVDQNSSPQSVLERKVPVSESKENSKRIEGQIWLTSSLKKMTSVGVLSENGLWEIGQFDYTC